MNDSTSPTDKSVDKTRPISELWSIVNPGPLPEMASTQDAVQAFKDSKITSAELLKVQNAVERRTNKYLRSQGYDVD
jgi:hypothetical protein